MAKSVKQIVQIAKDVADGLLQNMTAHDNFEGSFRNLLNSLETDERPNKRAAEYIASEVLNHVNTLCETEANLNSYWFKLVVQEYKGTSNKGKFMVLMYHTLQGFVCRIAIIFKFRYREVTSTQKLTVSKEILLPLAFIQRVEI